MNSASRRVLAQLGQGPRHRALHRPDRAVQHLGQPAPRSGRRKSAAPLPPAGAGAALRAHRAPPGARPASAAMSPAVALSGMAAAGFSPRHLQQYQVDQVFTIVPADVDLRVVAVQDPLPAWPRPHQRCLDQILGQGPVAGQQPSGSLEHASRSLHELCEACLLGVHGTLRSAAPPARAARRLTRLPGPRKGCLRIWVVRPLVLRLARQAGGVARAGWPCPSCRHPVSESVPARPARPARLCRKPRWLSRRG